MVNSPLEKEVDIIRRIDLNMDEQKKYEVIKKLVDSKGNKDRAVITLDITRRQVDRLIIAYKEKDFVHFTELLQRNEGITLSVSAVTNFLETENIRFMH